MTWQSDDPASRMGIDPAAPHLLASLADEVREFIQANEPDEERFNDLLRRVHDAQCHTIAPLGRLAAAKDRGPGQVGHWLELPAVPAAAYKRYLLYGGTTPPVRTFTSSGTTGADPSRAAYSIEGLRLMDTAISANARRMLFPDGRATRILVLAPPPEAAPGMIMAYGMQRLIEEFGLPGSRFLLGPGGLDPAGILALFESAAVEAVPVTLIGASFGFVHLFDAMAGRGARIEMPVGSRTMDAGGFKGRSREVSAAEMRAAMGERLGIDPDMAVNLLGMTELPSQLYDDRLAARFEGRPALDGKRIPPWMRTAVIDPETLEPAAPGKPGMLLHVDLANLERPLATLSDDLGVMEADGSFRVLGRAQGAEARGCSLSIEEWTRAQQEGG